MTINEASSLKIPRLTLIILFFAIAVMTGCASSPDDSNLKKGASTGAAVGAGIGLLFGALTGDSEIAATAAVLPQNKAPRFLCIYATETSSNSTFWRKTASSLRDAPRIGPGWIARRPFWIHQTTLLAPYPA